MNQYLAWFDEIPDEALGSAAGGKGASLCRMSRANLPVPKGFIVHNPEPEHHLHGGLAPSCRRVSPMFIGRKHQQEAI